MIGKPYSGKLNVRFDEGELEIEPSATTPALYSTRLSQKSNKEFAKYEAVALLDKVDLEPPLEDVGGFDCLKR